MLKTLKILTFWRFTKSLLKIEHRYISESCRGEDYFSDGVSHMSEGLLDIAKGDVPDTPFLDSFLSLFALKVNGEIKCLYLLS